MPKRSKPPTRSLRSRAAQRYSKAKRNDRTNAARQRAWRLRQRSKRAPLPASHSLAPIPIYFSQAHATRRSLRIAVANCLLLTAIGLAIAAAVGIAAHASGEARAGAALAIAGSSSPGVAIDAALAWWHGLELVTVNILAAAIGSAGAVALVGWWLRRR